MLYKKIHRQYLREFKKGRRFKYYDGSYNVRDEVTSKPYIDYSEGAICVKSDYDGLEWCLIPIDDYYYPRGVRLQKNEIKWLN